MKIVRIICLVLVFAGLVLATVSCNTTKGVGRDIEDAGDAVDRAL